jgi:5-methyltetrahydropteroyltriglutamate--homocysteine methyltransferase
MAIATNLGFPRIGANRELKRAVEAFWAGKLDEAALQQTASEIRRENWLFAQAAGIQHIPSNDFSFYDQILDTTALVGAVPARYEHSGGMLNSATYFAMARGNTSVPAMEMTKWFDTNYHYIVPELEPDQIFALSSTKPIDEFLEAKALGVHTRPVLVGPVTYLLLAKSTDGHSSTLPLLERLLPVYEEVLQQLAAAGADWVQIDEPMLAMTLSDEERRVFGPAYAKLAAAAPSLKLLLATYFGDLRENRDTALALPVAGLHVDLVRGAGQLEQLLTKLSSGMALSLGVVDGRNIWKTNLDGALATVETAIAALGTDRVLIAPSCSLLHSPVDLAIEETTLDAEMRSWMAFARQKVSEIATLSSAVNAGRASVQAALAKNTKAMESRRTSPRIHNPKVKERLAAVDDSMLRRKSAFHSRRQLQQQALHLPAFPTTTIGSFPQTTEIRKARASFRRKEVTPEQYQQFLREEIARVVRFQEQVGLDVLVHGEPERNDMVEYFGEQMEGYVSTKNGWVQSYGSRAVKPPIIFGDVNRPTPMTVEWATYAQSLTDRPLKGMLTGPVTMLQWSFVRDDQPRSDTCYQLALAIRDEVVDLEAAGIRVIQIDEPAIREGLPLRREDWAVYLKWAVESFRLTSSGVTDTTQIHTHMCYSEFNDMIASIGAMDADVISIESSRSRMELLEAFVQYKYPNEIGPGVYDIHSPRVAATQEMKGLLAKAMHVLSPDQLWVNPDCGLKTRNWPEVEESLAHMVEAARELRQAAKV